MTQESTPPKLPEQIKLQLLDTIIDQILTGFEHQIDSEQHHLSPQNYQTYKDYRKALENKYRSQIVIDENLILEILIQNQDIFDYRYALNYMPKGKELEVNLIQEDEGFKTIVLLIQGVIMQSLEETFSSNDFETTSNSLFLTKLKSQASNYLKLLPTDNLKIKQDNFTKQYISLIEQVKTMLRKNIQNKVIVLNHILDIKKKDHI